MKSFALLAASLLVAVSFAQAKSAVQAKLAVQKTVEQQMANHNRSMAKKDIKGVQATMAPDFTVMDARGQPVPRKAVVAQVVSLFKAARTIKASSKIRSFKLEKRNAHLVSHNTLDFDLPGNNGKRSKVHMDTTSDEVWEPVKGTYKIKSVRALKRKVTVDGKVVPG